jgi:F420-non-reducing hydrogenase small subunit
MTARLAEEWFAICGGCEVTILDIGEPLLEVLKQVDIVHMPVLMDHKLYGQTGENEEISIPEADIGILTGGIRNEEHKKIAIEMRKKVKTLIALGSCATHGGIPALANLSTTDQLLEKIYHGSHTTDGNGIPHEEIPPLTDRVYAVSEVVPVDISLPGCPTTPSMVAGALMALLEGKPYNPPTKSVCDECPTKREKKAGSTLKRRFEQAEFDVDAPISEMRCLMEQGFLCLGPATLAGCAEDSGVPRCVRAHVPCEGCFGPLTAKSNPMVDMMGALSSIGLDPKQIPDRAATFNRFAGAGRLRPVPGGKR